MNALSGADAYRGGTVPWLPGPAKEGMKKNGQENTQLAWVLTAGMDSVGMCVLLALIAQASWYQQQLAIVLGTKLQALMLVLTSAFFLANLALVRLQHEYEGYQVIDYDGSSAPDRTKANNRWLRELAIRAMAFNGSAGMLCFAAAAYGLTTPVLAATAVAAVCLCGPYAPVIDVPINGRPALLLSTWAFVAYQLAQVAFGFGLWKVFGPPGLLVLLLYTLGAVFEVAMEATLNQWLHPLSHMTFCASFGMLLYLTQQLVV